MCHLMHWCLKWTCQLIQHWLLNDIKWNERKVCCGQIEFSQARISSKSLIESLPMTKLWNIFYAEKMILVNRWYKMPDRSDAIFDSLNLEFKIYGKVLPEDETRKNGVEGCMLLSLIYICIQYIHVWYTYSTNNLVWKKCCS